MRKRNHFRQLGRTPTHKMAMLRNMVSSLIDHERIVTTVAKAKEVQRLAEKIITIAKKATHKAAQVLSSSSSSLSSSEARTTLHTSDDVTSSSATTSTNASDQEYMTATAALLHGRRQIQRIVRTEMTATKVMNVLRHRYYNRTGGYTRILKLSKPRAGDNADMAIIEYVDHNNEVRAARPPIATLIPADSATAINNKSTLSSVQVQQQLETLQNLYKSKMKS
jgi:large subunit ribosomal protein L17